MSRGSENPTKRKRVGSMREKGNEARATWSICAKTTLVPRFGADPATMEGHGNIGVIMTTCCIGNDSRHIIF